MGLHAAKANGQQYGFRKSTLWAGMKHTGRNTIPTSYIVLLRTAIPPGHLMRLRKEMS